MTEKFEFEPIFAVPEEEHDEFALFDAIFEAGFENVIVGTGHSHMLGVALETEGNDAESAILQAARTLIKALPAGTALRKIYLT